MVNVKGGGGVLVQKGQFCEVCFIASGILVVMSKLNKMFIVSDRYIPSI